MRFHENGGNVVGGPWHGRRYLPTPEEERVGAFDVVIVPALELDARETDPVLISARLQTVTYRRCGALWVSEDAMEAPIAAGRAEVRPEVDYNRVAADEDPDIAEMWRRMEALGVQRDE